MFPHTIVDYHTMGWYGTTMNNPPEYHGTEFEIYFATLQYYHMAKRLHEGCSLCGDNECFHDDTLDGKRLKENYPMIDKPSLTIGRH